MLLQQANQKDSTKTWAETLVRGEKKYEEYEGELISWGDAEDRAGLLRLIKIITYTPFMCHI